MPQTPLITFAGTPPTTTLPGTSFVTTAPAATTEFFAHRTAEVKGPYSNEEIIGEALDPS